MRTGRAERAPVNGADSYRLNRPQQRLHGLLAGAVSFLATTPAPTAIFSQQVLTGTDALEWQHRQGPKVVHARELLEDPDPVLGALGQPVHCMRPIEARLSLTGR